MALLYEAAGDVASKGVGYGLGHILAVGRDVERLEPGLDAVLGADEAVAEGQIGGAGYRLSHLM